MTRRWRVIFITISISLSTTAGADSLTLASVQELQGNLVVTAVSTRDGADTRVELYVSSQGAILNPTLGIDKVYYDNDAVVHPIIRVAGADSDEWVVDGNASGWKTNYDGCLAGMFGCFASRSSSNSGSGDGTSPSSPLIIWIAGDAFIEQVAVHIRFEGASGWMTNRPTSMWIGEPGSDPGFRLASTVPEPQAYVLLTVGCMALLRIKNVHILRGR